MNRKPGWNDGILGKPTPRRLVRLGLVRLGLARLALAAPAALLAATTAILPICAQETSTVTMPLVPPIAQSLIRGEQMKQEASTIVDAITVQDIDVVPDRSLSQTLPRLPGVLLGPGPQDGEGIQIDGLGSPRLEVNGDDAFSARNRAFASVPADMVSTVEVQHSPSADMIEGGVAGTLNVTIRRPFDVKDPVTVASIAGGAGAHNPSGAMALLAGNRWQAPGGELGILASVAASQLWASVDQRHIAGMAVVQGRDDSHTIDLVLRLAGTSAEDDGQSYRGDDFGLTARWRPSDRWRFTGEASRTDSHFTDTVDLASTTPSWQGQQSGFDDAIKADGEYAIDLGWLESLKFGAREAEHHGETRPAGTAADLFIADRTVVPFNASDGPKGSAMFDTTAGYAMMRFGNPETALFGTLFDVSGNIGVRTVASRMLTSQTAASGAVGWPDSALAPSHGDIRTLPQLNLNIGLNDRMQLRLALAETMQALDPVQITGTPLLYPLINPLTGGRILHDSLPAWASSAGNPVLNPETAQQVDLAWDTAFADDGALAIGGFGKSIAGAVVKQATWRTASDAGVTVPVAIVQPVNLASRFALGGVTLSAHQFFHALPAPFDGLGVDGSYTHVWSGTVPNAGASVATTGSAVLSDIAHDTLSVAGLYEKGDHAFRLTATWRSCALSTGVALGSAIAVTPAPFGSIDAAYFYRVTRTIKVGLEAHNLYDSYRKTLFDEDGFPRAHPDGLDDRHYSLSLRGQF